MQKSKKEIVLSLLFVLFVYITRGVYIYFDESVTAWDAAVKALSELSLLVMIFLIAIAGAFVLLAIRYMVLRYKHKLPKK